MAHTRSAANAPVGSQTLSRGLTALEILAAHDRPMSLNELAEALEVHRSNAYRVLRTLEEHRLVLRDGEGLIRLGPRLTVLARGVAPGLSTAAAKPVADLANAAGMTAFLTVLDEADVITIHSAEPTNVDVAVARRPGTRHSILVGAPGHALEALLTRERRLELLGTETLSEQAQLATARGYAVSESEVMGGVSAIAVPVHIAGEPPAALALAHFAPIRDSEALAGQLLLAASRITQSYH